MNQDKITKQHFLDYLYTHSRSKKSKKIVEWLDNYILHLEGEYELCKTLAEEERKSYPQEGLDK